MEKTSKRYNRHGLGKITPLNKRAEWYRWNDIIDYLFAPERKFQRKIKILDVGCGDGLLAKYLNDRNETLDKPYKIEYYGLDNYKSYTKSKYLANSKFILGDIGNMESLFDENYFDVVIASEVIEHIDETDKLIINIRRILKPEGFLYLTTPNLACWHARLFLLFGYLPLPMEVSNIRSGFGKGKLNYLYSGEYEHETVHHIRCFTLGALKEFLFFHGYRIVQLNGGAYGYLTNRFFRNLVNFSPVIKLICTKIPKPK